MDADLAGRYLAVDPIDDGGCGFRLHTDRDEVYEARRIDEADVRVYGGEDAWEAKVRIPTTDIDDAYEAFNATVQKVDGTYGTDLFTPATTFLDTAEADGTPRSSEDTITVRYNDTGRPRHDAVAPEDAEGTSLKALLGSGSISGAATGGTLFGATPELLALGAGGGAIVGALAGGAYWAANPKTLGALSDRLHIDHQAAAIRNAYRRRTADDEDRLQDDGFIDAINEKRRLDAVAETTEDMDQARRYRELREESFEDTLEEIMTYGFEEFESLQGVTATYTADGYEEVMRFVETVTGCTTDTTGRPSLMRDDAVFADLFEAADHERQEELVHTVQEEGAAEPVQAYLDAHHPDLVERVGRDRALAGDTR